MESTRIEKIQILALFVVAIVILFWSNHTTVLFNQDEAAYAGFASRMLNTGNWLVPEFHWSEVHRKTPFHFWMIALSYVIFGVNEFAVRFSSSIFTLGSLSLVFLVGRRIWSQKIAIVACYVLLSSILFTALGKIAVTDGTLLFFHTWSALSLIRFVQTQEHKWRWQFWVAISIGMLVKGPPIVVFSGLLGLLTLIFHPDGKRIWKLQPFFYFTIALIPLFVWGYLAWQDDQGVFVSWLVDWYILNRVDGHVFGQTGPPGYYVLIFMVSFIVFLPDLINTLIRSFHFRNKSNWLFIGLWCVSGWLLYEFLKSKLPAYTIAAHPALALGIAYFMTHEGRGRTGFLKWSYAIFSLIMMIASALIWWYAPALSIELIKWPVVFFCLLVAGVSGYHSYQLFREVRQTGTLIWLALIPNFILWFWLLPLTQDGLSGLKSIGPYIDGLNPSSNQVTIGQAVGKPPALPFYLEQNGLDVAVETDTVKMYEKYNRSTEGTFILSESQLDYFRKLTPDFEVHEIQSFDVDHQKMQSYFVALKK